MTRSLAISILTSALLAIGSLSSFAASKDKPGLVLQPHNQTEQQGAEKMIQGSQLLRDKQPFKARPLLEQAVQLWPTIPQGWFNLGLCYGDVGEFTKAIEAYQTALKYDKNMTEALPNIGTCYQMMDQPEQAIPWFEKYLREEPHAADAPQIQGMINALRNHESKQISSNPQAPDYLASVSPGGHVQRWSRNNVPIRVFISDGRDEQGHKVSGFRDYYNEILVDTIDTWIKASNGRLAYQIVDNANSANIVCTWTDKTDFLKESGNAVEQGAARISARPISNTEDEIGHCRVIVLISDVQGHGNISDDVLKMACLHEFGHALGLAGHSNNNRDVMFFSESPTVWAALTKRDKATMARLYSDYPLQSPQMATQQPSMNQSTFTRQQASQMQSPQTMQAFGHTAPTTQSFGEFGQSGQGGQFGQSGQFAQSSQYQQPGRLGQTGQSGQFGQSSQYQQPGRPGQTGLSSQFGQLNQLGQPGQYAQSGQYGQAGQYGQSGQYNPQSQYSAPQQGQFGQQSAYQQAGQQNSYQQMNPQNSYQQMGQQNSYQQPTYGQQYTPPQPRRNSF